jgi:hypothetical protein
MHEAEGTIKSPEGLSEDISKVRDEFFERLRKATADPSNQKFSVDSKKTVFEYDDWVTEIPGVGQVKILSATLPAYNHNQTESVEITFETQLLQGGKQ